MKLIVNPHKIEIIKEPINEREIDITKCEFEFADEITSDYVKEAYFTFNGTSYKQIIVNNECDIPSEVLTNKGQVEVGVVAFLVENEQEIKRYNPSPAYFNTWLGSLKDDAENSEPITPSEMEQYEQALQDGLSEVNEKLDDINQALEDVGTAIEETNNLNLDVSKSGKVATVTLTKKDATTKIVTLSDGTSLMFNWDGTKLGIKTDEDADYTYVDLQGIQGPIGPKGEAFTIKKTYSSVVEMNADFNNMQLGDYVMIASTVEVEDNAKLYTRGEEQWIFISDFSGATGIRGETGATPNIQIGTVSSGATPSVTRTGTNENPVLNFVLEKGDTGETGATGATGPQGFSPIATVTQSSSGASISIIDTNGTTTANITNGEVTQAQLDYVSKYANALVKESASGTSITIDDTAECPLEIKLTQNEIEQITTNGSNILNPNYVINGSFTTSTQIVNNTDYSNIDSNLYRIIRIPNLTAGTYSFRIEWNKTLYVIRKYTDNTLATVSTKINNNIFTFTTEADGLAAFQFRTSDTTEFTDNEIRMMLVSGTYDETNYPDYEPYTGGQASPNPDYPQEIHTISGDNTITISNSDNTKSQTYPLTLGDLEYCKIGDYEDEFVIPSGKNLFDENNVTFTTGILDDNGQQTSSSSSHYTNNYYSVSPNSNYILSGTISTGVSTCRIYFYDENKNWISRTDAISGSPISIATPNNCYYIKIQVALSITLQTNNVQLEQGITATSYEPYNDGKWYLKKNIGKNLFDGTEKWSLNAERTSTAGTYLQFVVNKSILTDSKLNSAIISNYFKQTNLTAYAFNNVYIGYSNFNICIDKKVVSDLASFKTWLSSHNTIVYYKLATPTYIPLNNTLQTQLDNIYNWALSYSEQTNISQVNDDLPFVINATAVKDMNTLISELATRVEVLESEATQL